jgi:hypothetical protein
MYLIQITLHALHCMHSTACIYGTTIKWAIEELSPDSCCKIFIPVLIKAYVADTVSILFFVVNLSLLLSVRSGILLRVVDYPTPT